MSFTPTEEHLSSNDSYIRKEGNYTLVVKSIDKKYKNEKTCYELLLACTVTGKMMTETLWETEKAAWRICMFLKSCSIQIKKGSQVSLDDGSYIGNTFCASVIMSEPNEKGNKYAEIQEFKSGDYDSLFFAGIGKTTNEGKW